MRYSDLAVVNWWWAVQLWAPCPSLKNDLIFSRSNFWSSNLTVIDVSISSIKQACQSRWIYFSSGELHANLWPTAKWIHYRHVSLNLRFCPVHLILCKRKSRVRPAEKTWWVSVLQIQPTRRFVCPTRWGLCVGCSKRHLVNYFLKIDASTDSPSYLRDHDNRIKWDYLINPGNIL
jgi:hypothetical protein